MSRSFSLLLKKSCVCILAGSIGIVSANPQLNGVVSGSASVSQTATTTTVNQSSQKAIINWNSFNIGAGETTQFVQPNASSVALNRVNPAQGASQIYGSLSANGQIILINAAGIHFGPGSMVNVGGLIASTSDISNDNFLAGIYKFDAPSPYAGSIVNEGSIIAANHGLIALLGHTVRNDGLIQAELGNIVLASGNKFTLDFYGDQLINFTVDEGVANGSVTNTGTLLADGGKILVSAKTAQNTLDNVINMNGIAQARSVDQHNGEIILSANGSINVTGTLDAAGMSDQAVGGKIKILGDYIHLASTAKLDASGHAGGGEILIGGNYQGKGPEQNALGTTIDAGAVINADAITSGDGGKVIVWSDGDTLFHGSASARGGSQSGNGGLVETSGHYLNIAGALVDTSAANGKSGTWLLDPNDVTISSSPTSVDEVYNSGTYTPTLTNPSNINVTDLVNNLQTSNVTVLTSGAGVGNGDIAVNAAITWSSNNTLTLTATRNIYLNADITATNGELALSAVNGAQITPGLGGGSIGSGTIGSSPSFVTANINVKDFTLLQGQWYQYDLAGSSPLATFSVSNDFTIASGTTYNGIFNAQFIRMGNLGVSDGIQDIYGLQGIATSPLGTNYNLVNNIDATVTSNWNNGTGFVPIGTYGGVNRFYAGSFNGQNKTINNLFINRTLTTQSSTENLGVGLFGYSSGGISNVGVTNANITLTLNYGDTPGYYGLGALVGLNRGFISNSYSTGSVVGNMTSSSLISLKVGGLLGYNRRTDTAANITNSYSTANVTLNTPAASATSNIQVGGFVGANEAGTITNSFSAGKVSVTGLATGAFALVGGFVGGVFGNDTFVVQGKIENSYSTGSVTAESIYSIGGFAGLLAGSGVGGTATPGSVTNVYSLGNVSATTLATDIGGLIGLRSASSGITNSFWNTQTSGLSSSNGSTGAAGYRGMTTAEMQTQTNFTNTANGFVTTSNAWDFTTVWGMNSGSFPYLKAQYSSAPRVISGYIPGGSATATGLTGTNNVQLYVNGTALSSNGITTQGLLSSYDNGFYYGLQSNGAVANGSAILANYVSGTANAITVVPNAGGNITGLNLTSNTVALGDDNVTSISATTMNTARNAPVAIYTISGNDITLNSGIGLSSTANTTFTINGTITGPAAGSIGGNVNLLGSTVLSTNTTLLGSGSINLGGVNLNTFSLTINNANSSSISGVIGGSGNLVKEGAGILTLGAANTYTGSTTINSGILRAGILNALPSTTTITLADTSGVSLELNGFNQTISALEGGGSFGGNVVLGNGSLTIQNAINGYTATYGGVISGGLGGTGGLTVNLTGSSSSLTLNRNHTYTGATTVSAGTLQIGSGGSTGSLNGTSSISLGSGTLLRVIRSGTIALGNITGTGGLTKSGTGTLQLTGTNTYSGTTTISTGVVQATGANTLSPNSSITLSNVASAILNLNGFSNQVKSIAGGGTSGGNISLGSGTLAIENAASSGSTYSGVISGGGGLTINLAGVNPVQTLDNIHTYLGTTTIVAGTLQLTGLLNAGSQIVNNGNLNLSSNNNVFLGNNISGSGSLYQLSGIKTLYGNLTYTGTTFINGGTLAFESNATLNNINVSSGANLRVIDAALTGNITLNTSSNLVGVGTASVGGSISLAGSSSISTTVASDVFTINAPINGAQSLGFQGAGTINVATTIGGTTPISSLTTASASSILLNGNIISSGTQSYSGAVTLGSNRTLTSGGITLTNGASGSFNLTLAGGNGNDIFNIGGNLGINALTVTGGAGTNDLNFGNYSSAISANLTADQTGTVSGNATQIASFTGIHNLIGNDQGLISVSGTLSNSALHITSLGQGYVQGTSPVPTNFSRFTNPVPSASANLSNISNTLTNSATLLSSAPTTNNQTNSFAFAAKELVVNTLSATNSTITNINNNYAMTPSSISTHCNNPFSPTYTSNSGSGGNSSANTVNNNTAGGTSTANNTTPLFSSSSVNLTLNLMTMMDQVSPRGFSITESSTISASCS